MSVSVLPVFSARSLIVSGFHFRKALKNIRRSQEKLENSFAELQTELKALKSRKNNAEERISDLEYRTDKTQR